MTRRIALAVLLLGAAATVLAQTASEAITVHLIEVPVYVERNGASVAGLTKDDFELRVNGREREIVSFDVVATDAPAAAQQQQQAPPLRRRRLSVLLFDSGNIPLSHLPNARRAAMKFVATAPPGDSFAVAILDRRGISLTTAFTPDRAAVQRAISTFAVSTAGDPLLLATTDAERATLGTEAEGTTNAEARTSDAAPTTLANRLHGEEKLRAQRAAIETLAAFADRLAPIDAIKQVIFISEGWNFADFGMRATDINSLKPLTVRMHERFRAAGVTLSAVDAAGLRAPGDSGGIAISDELYSLALDTGGTVTTTLTQLRETQRVVYILGFRAGSERNPEVSVRLKNQPGARALHPRGFAPAKKSAADEALFLADVIMNDIPQEGLSVRLTAAKGEVTAQVPGRELLALAESRKPLEVDALFYVFDERNAAVAWKQRRVAVNVERGREFLESNAFPLREAFELRSGRYTAKVVVRVVGKDAVGFRRAEFTVP